MLHVSRPALASVIAIILAVTESSILHPQFIQLRRYWGIAMFRILVRLGLLRQTASLRIASMALARVVREIGHRQAVAQSWSQVC